MLRLIVRQIAARRGRASALVGGVVVATASFTVLTGAAETGRLRVRGTVAKSFRTGYDVLVRPHGSRGSIERSRGLVRPGALSGIPGGITLGQWRRVRHLPGIEVAAPVATIGYALPPVALPLDLTASLGRRRSALFRVDVTRRTDRGLTRRTDAPVYAYATRRRLLPEPKSGGPATVFAPRLVKRDGGQHPVCNNGYPDIVPTGPFDLDARGGERGDLVCASTRSGVWGEGFRPFPRGHVGALIPTALPFVIAAIDPAQEAKLTGLPQAITSGRALNERDRPTETFVPEVPVVAADRPFSDEVTDLSAFRLGRSARTALERARSPRATNAALPARGGTLVARRSFDPAQSNARLLSALMGHARYRPVVTVYWTVGGTRYTRGSSGSLRPRAVRNPASVWESEADLGYVAAPLSADDRQFRRLTPSVGSARAQDGQVFPALRAVGRFDPSRLPTGDGRVDAALGIGVTPGLVPRDARSRKLLGGRALLPNGNIGGYQTQGPLLLTNLGSLRAFADPNFSHSQGQAPISAIRVRVANVHGIDDASRERVRQAAQRISAATGLDVDLTIGSSVSPQRIELPGGRHGRPRLALSEAWVRKGVALTVLRAIDRKSVALFALILAVCLMFVFNANAAAVAARRTELGVLACVGWSPSSLFALVLGEVALIGLAAGVLGGAVALLAAGALHVHASLARAALAVPTAVALAVLAAAIPARRAARAHPASALQPPVTGARHAHTVRNLRGLAAVNVLRVPARSAVATVSLAVGVAALTTLLAITLAFRGAVVGSVLGDTVAVNVRTVDYIAVLITVGLAAVGVADVLYLNVRERAAELALLRATGWSSRQLATLIAGEALILGCAGSLLGAVTGVALSSALTGKVSDAALAAAVLSALGGVALSLTASTLPARLAARRTVTAELAA
jgi:putative ABC transport system permease protein